MDGVHLLLHRTAYMGSAGGRDNRHFNTQTHRTTMVNISTLHTRVSSSFIFIHSFLLSRTDIILSRCLLLVSFLCRGQGELLLFFIIVNLSVAVLSSLYYLVIFVCTKDAEFLFTDSYSHIRGLSGYLGGICVAVRYCSIDLCFELILEKMFPFPRQVMPDLLIVKSRFGVLTNRYNYCCEFPVPIF